MKIDDCAHALCHCCGTAVGKDGYCSDECRLQCRGDKGCDCAHEDCCGKAKTRGTATRRATPSRRRQA
jgi:hypothetical protein